ncbi:MAG: S-layer homology domain-containing protein [Clostridiales bacterium]|jgi:hypothetical protein|nr:S-layer homology domain-containing protein [Clostridiales bacterium]
MRSRFWCKIAVLLIGAIVGVVSASSLLPGASIKHFWADIDNAPIEFVDLGEHQWAADSIDFLTKNGIMSGKLDKKFDPEGKMLRSEFAKVIVNAFGLYDGGAHMDFFDNQRDMWHFSYISSLAQTGISRGFSDEYYGSYHEILRQDAAVIIKKAIDYVGFIVPNKADAINAADYSDYSEIDDYARESVDFLSKCGILNGDRMDDGRILFYPRASATRAEIAVLTAKILSVAEM